MVVIRPPDTADVTITTQPANPATVNLPNGERQNRYDTVVKVTGKDGSRLSDVTYELYYFNAAGQRRRNVDFNFPSRPPTESVDYDNTDVSEPERRSVTVNVGGLETNVDYSVQYVGNAIVVPQESYNTTVRIPPAMPRYVSVPVTAQLRRAHVVGNQNLSGFLP